MKLKLFSWEIVTVWIIFCSLGVVAETGTHKELIKLKGIYARLYELQCGIVEESDENLQAEEQES